MDSKTTDKSRKLRNDFDKLSIEDKIKILLDLEIMTVAEGFQKLGECSISLANRILKTVVPDATEETAGNQQAK